MEKKQIKELIETMYQAGFCAVCQCDNNPSGAFPCDCTCEQTKERKRILDMLLETKKELIKKVDHDN